MEYRLGKSPAEISPRTLKMKVILSTLPPIPDVWDFDEGKIIPTPMFANDTYGNCVIAGRAHQTLRFEYREQGCVIDILDQDVISEYEKESGGSGPEYDNGLSLLQSLRAWREGWLVGGHIYNINAFASVDFKNDREIKAVASNLAGLYCGFLLPLSAKKQLDAGQIWDVDLWPFNKDSWRGSWGGHCCYCVGYNFTGPILITWGKRQQVTWRWMHKYCDEAFGIVDDVDKLSKYPIDVEALEGLLKQCCEI